MKLSRRNLFGVGVGAAAAIGGAATAGPITGGLRLSTDKDDPGADLYYRLNSEGKTVRIYLDGVEQRNCTMADRGLGIIKRAKLNAHGEMYTIRDEVAEEIVHGRVHIEICDGAPRPRLTVLQRVRSGPSWKEFWGVGRTKA